MNRVLVAGANGFAGKHLVKELKSAGCEVWGIVNSENSMIVSSASIDKLFVCDLTDQSKVAKLDLAGVDTIINLAGIAVNSRTDSADIINLNVSVHTVLYDRLLVLGASPRIIAIGSAAIYDSTATMPLIENSPLQNEDSTSYVKSKQQLETVLNEKYSGKLDYIVVRPFNHMGPGQRPGFLLPDWANKLCNAKSRSLDVSNLNSYRDFTDVRDVVKAYAKLALNRRETLRYDMYNICSGRPRLIHEVIGILANHFGISLPPLNGVPKGIEIYGDHQRLTSDTGWTPEIPLEKTIQDFAKWYLNEQENQRRSSRLLIN